VCLFSTNAAVLSTSGNVVYTYHYPLLYIHICNLATMGGNAFPVQAERMSSETHEKLYAHSHSTLVPAFFPRAEALRDVRDKKDHGDLDLIAGWADERAWKLKGEERGEVAGGMKLGGAMALRQEGQGQGELVDWAFRMAKALKAAEWVRRGSEISFAIPCSVLGRHEKVRSIQSLFNTCLGPISHQ
jgi:hypothetical protein